jgi:hypothetical protein
MTHLTRNEVVDYVEGTLAGRRAAHAAACAECSRLATELRALLREARQVAAPDPSPLFWDHLSRRVRDAVAAEPPAPRRWFASPSPRWVVAAAPLAVALVVAAGVLQVWRTAPRGDSPADATAVVSAPDVAEPVESDLEWELVMTMTGDVAWEDVDAAGLDVRPGAAERAAQQLTADERDELARLLRMELEQPKS